jgi:hypothetical protein
MFLWRLVIGGGWKLLAGIGALLGGWLAWRGQRQAGREDAIRDLDLRKAEIKTAQAEVVPIRGDRELVDRLRKGEF